MKWTGPSLHRITRSKSRHLYHVAATLSVIIVSYHHHLFMFYVYCVITFWERWEMFFCKFLVFVLLCAVPPYITDLLSRALHDMSLYMHVWIC